MGDTARDRWQSRYEQARVRDVDFSTLSGVEVEPAYGTDTSEWPGEFPFTRGLYPTGYRGRTWTIRQFAGFGNAQQTNERYQMILGRGGGGLSVAFDMPTLMGRDSDDPRSLGEVGHCGVAIDSAEDMEILFRGIDLAEVTTSMTISGPAVPVFCMMLVAAERAGVDTGKLNGTLQTDIFKEYIAQKEWIFGPEPHLRLIGDLMEHCLEKIPAYKPLSVSGYHIREAGSTAAQELAFTLADGFGYVELGLERGLDVDEFAPGLSFFFDAHVDFFEEIAKFRAARRIWARWLRDVYGATSEKAQWLRFHTQTAGVSLTAQQPYNNVVRTGIEALSAVLAHQRPRRDPRPALRAGRRDRAADPAGDHGGDRRRQRRGPPRRLLVRRGAHRPARGRGQRDLRQGAVAGRLDADPLRHRAARRGGVSR
jgi:methylmalonyl-CoA mutase N-terminal domain/subunit